MPKTKKPSKSKDLLGFLVFCGPVRTIAHNGSGLGEGGDFHHKC